MSNKKFGIIWLSILSIVLVFAIAVNILMYVFSGYVDLHLGTGEIVITKTEGSEDWDASYYTLDYADSAAVEQAANLLVEHRGRGHCADEK